MEKAAKLILDKITNITPDYISYCVAEAEYSFYISCVLFGAALTLLILSCLGIYYFVKKKDEELMFFSLMASITFFIVMSFLFVNSLQLYKQTLLAQGNPKGYAINRIINKIKE